MESPSQVFAQTLIALKGWFAPSALDYHAPVSSDVSISSLQGRVVSLNQEGEFETGISGTKMPLFCVCQHEHAAKDIIDVDCDGIFMFRALSSNGHISALVATGGYELSTTAFDKTPAIPYRYNQLLTAKTNNKDPKIGGVLSNNHKGAGGQGGAVRQYIDPVCGVVSRLPHINEHGEEVLSFWPVFLPGAYKKPLSQRLGNS